MKCTCVLRRVSSGDLKIWPSLHSAFLRGAATPGLAEASSGDTINGIAGLLCVLGYKRTGTHYSLRQLGCAGLLALAGTRHGAARSVQSLGY